MKRQICRLFAAFGMISFLTIGLEADVLADTVVEYVEITEEERYEPEYYMPLETTATTRSVFDEATFEADIVEQLSAHAAQIDVSQYQLTPEEVGTYYFRVLYNHAELFFVKSAYSYNYRVINGENLVQTLTPSYIMDKQEADTALEQMETVAQTALEVVSDEMEEYEKALAVHDWLVTYCEYDYENYMENSVPEESHTAYGAFVNKVAVCDGYSKAYQYIMKNKLGIPCIIVSSDSMGHAWNMIEIGENYYHIDVTWMILLGIVLEESIIIISCLVTSELQQQSILAGSQRLQQRIRHLKILCGAEYAAVFCMRVATGIM